MSKRAPACGLVATGLVVACGSSSPGSGAVTPSRVETSQVVLAAPTAASVVPPGAAASSAPARRRRPLGASTAPHLEVSVHLLGEESFALRLWAPGRSEPTQVEVSGEETTFEVPEGTRFEYLWGQNVCEGSSDEAEGPWQITAKISIECSRAIKMGMCCVWQ